MSFLRRNRTEQPHLSDEVAVTTIPESVLPGGPDAEAWQNAYADWLESEEGTAAHEDALNRMEALGMRTVTGRVEAVS